MRDGGDDISELVEEACIIIEYWRTLVMSWGALVVSVQDCPDYLALLVTLLMAQSNLTLETADLSL